MENTSWTIHVVGRTTLADTLRTQDALLRQGDPAVHVAGLQDTVVSFGAGVSEGAPFLARARVRGTPTLRRSSGGTGVLHLPGDLVWAVILPRSDPRVGRDFVNAYARLGAGLVTVLARHGGDAAWTPAPGLSDDYCPLGHRGQVLSIRGLVVGAAAQHLTGTALLHQGMLSFEVDRPLTRDLFSFPNDAAADRLSGVHELGVDRPTAELAEEVAQALVDALERS
jgi:lipoate-protein ligase A